MIITYHGAHNTYHETLKSLNKQETSSMITKYSKIITALSYISFLFVVPLIVQHKDEFARHHVRQGIVLFLFEIIVSLIAPIPLFGWILGPLGWLASLVFAVYGVTNAFFGRESILPYIGKWAEKIRI